MSDPVTVDAVLTELVALARSQPALLQFRTLASAHQYRGLHRLWREHVPVTAEVLDWGAGNGHFSYFLVRSGYRATGFSFEPFTFKDWLPPGSYCFVAGCEDEPARLPFGDSTFDAVASVGVLEHVRESGGTEAASLAEIARVLRPGGLIICWHLPNRRSWIELVARQFAGMHSHRYRFTPTDIRCLLVGAGLTLIDMRTYGLLPRNSFPQCFGEGRRARWVAWIWDGLDAFLTVPFRCIAQNHAFVARKPPANTRAG